MKSKYLLWMVGLLTLVSCDELTCDFTYSPETPAAGSVVSFTNKSTGADDYYWTFGDNGTSTTSSPTHMYMKPGTYTVTLQIIRNKVEKRSRTQHITIIDTIPTIACDSDTVYAFTPTTFKAQLYNPWKKTVTYRWTTPDDAVVLAGKSLDSSAIVCYFNQSVKASQVSLKVQMNDETPFSLTYPTPLFHQLGKSVLFIDKNQAFEQFTYIIEKAHVFEAMQATSLATNLAFLQAEQDTLYHYGDSIYTIAKVQTLLKQNIQGFQVDRLMNKIYAYSSQGLWVCDITGDYARQLTSDAVLTIKVDGDNNSIYWSTASGLYRHALLGTLNNQGDFTPQLVNNASAISRISVNYNLH